MSNFEHKQIAERLLRLDAIPDDTDAYAEWVKASGHLDFLRKSASSDEFIVYAASDTNCIHTIAVPNERLFPLKKDDLLNWSFNPWRSCSSYWYGGGDPTIRIERGLHQTGSETLANANQLIYGRTFEGWSGPERNYFELAQEYAHLSGIHWRPEQRAYCKFDDRGDMEEVVSVTNREDKAKSISLVTFKWEPLEDYLAASDCSLVRMFDFMMLRRGGFTHLEGATEILHDASGDLFYRQRVMPGYAGYARGVQIIGLRRPAEKIYKDISDGWSGRRDKRYVEFIAQDWRNKCIANISTDPGATTNYFEAKDNSLPFELSPAFFRPEVLLKYKADREKYTVSERDIYCRAAWHLRGIDVNEAGQIHAYICDLRLLPYEEQLHWASHNEEPRAKISGRAVTNDFKGEFTTFTESLAQILSIIDRWQRSTINWWTLRDEKLLKRVNIPLTASRDEWSGAFMDLAKLVVEGFEIKPLRAKLTALGVAYENKEQSITLLEKIRSHVDPALAGERLTGLRTVQQIRSVITAHASGSEAEKISREALQKHETYANHFRHVCSQVVAELDEIEKLME